MRHRSRCRGRHSHHLPLVCAAFGLGVFLALFCSLKLVAVLAGIALVVLGVRCLGR